jgi:hypothetical protein
VSPARKGRWTETILHSFCSPPDCTDGALPMVGVTLGASGYLYGRSNTATFQMTPGSAAAPGWGFQVIYDSGSDGLVLGKGGNLYAERGVLASTEKETFSN